MGEVSTIPLATSNSMQVKLTIAGQQQRDLDMPCGIGSRGKRMLPPPGLLGTQNDPKLLQVLGLPTTIDAVMPMPPYSVMERLLATLSTAPIP